MNALLLVELTMALIVFCADAVSEERPRPLGQRFVRAIAWPITLFLWFTHRDMGKLTRFGAIVWFLVIIGWLLSLEHDKAPSSTWFLVLGQVTLGFVVFCVDAMSADLHRHPVKRVLRSVFWVWPFYEYLRDDDSIKIIHASVTVWVSLTTGWLLALESDRLVGALPTGWPTWLPG